MFWKTVVVAVFIVGVFADESNLLSDNRENLRTLVRNQCKKAGAEDKVDEVVNATTAFAQCFTNLIDVSQMKHEIEEAKPNGALDEVFKKYCEKTPQLKTCIHTLLDGVKPCLDNDSKELIGSAKNGTDQLIDFICYKDGDRIALFISEQGPECFKEKMNGIRECGNKTFKPTTPTTSVENLTLAEKCAKFDEVSACIVTALEECSTPTPGNMAESMFRYVRKNSPCHDALPKN